MNRENMTHAAPARRKPIPSLYNLKVLAALMVIFIHAQTFMAPAVSAVVVPVCRVAVPLFFMITGYFFYAADPSILTAHARRSAVKLLKLAAVATFVYFAWTVGVRGWTEAVGGVFTAKRLLALCLLGTPLYGDHLWFVFAELVVVALAPLFARVRPRFLFAAMAVLLCLNLLLFGKYKFLTGSGCSETYARNWLFMGLPFFWMGWLIKKCENKIRLTKYSLSGGDFARFSHDCRTLGAFGCREQSAKRPLPDYSCAFPGCVFAFPAVSAVFPRSSRRGRRAARRHVDLCVSHHSSFRLPPCARLAWLAGRMVVSLRGALGVRRFVAFIAFVQQVQDIIKLDDAYRCQYGFR